MGVQDPFITEDRERTGEPPADAPPVRPVGEMSFEDALSELEGIVQKLERGQLDLETSIRAYERGTELRGHCAEKLREAELRVEKLTFDREGRASLKPLDE